MGLFLAVMKTLASRCFATLSLAITSLIHAGGPPSGVADSDWSSIRAAHEAWRHGFQKTATGYEAMNPGQQWRTQFDGRGFTAQPKEGGWQWGLELKSYGFAGAERAMSDTPTAQAEGQRLAYPWDATLEEWFVNDQRGLEHGYTVKQRPSSASASELAFTLGVRGELKPVIASDALGVEFRNDAGITVLMYAGLKVWDADGKVLRSRFEPAEGGVRLLVDERGARYPVTIDPIAQQAYVKASNSGINDNFGTSIAISGDTVVVGSQLEDGSGTGVNPPSDELAAEAGAAYVFVRNHGVWTQQAYLKASNTQAGDFFGRSVAISGDTIVVGAYQEDGSGTGVNSASDELASSAGAAYVFVRNANVWIQQAYLKASNTGTLDMFGSSLSVSGDTIIVGASAEDGSGAGVNPASDELMTSAGAAYVFTRSGSTWSQQAYLKASNPGANDNFGVYVAVSGDTIAVAAVGEDGSGTGSNPPPDELAPDSGAAYVFVRNGAIWSQQAYVKASNAQASDSFGYVALSDDTLVVGAGGEDGSGTGVNPPSDDAASSAGAAYVFVRNAGVWSQQAYLKASNSETMDFFGSSVAVSGDVIAVAANNEDGGGAGVNPPSDETEPSSGAVYVFVRHGSTWSQQAYLKAPNPDVGDTFGYSVAVSRDTVVTGAIGENGLGSGVNPPVTLSPSALGAAYFFAGFGPAEISVEQPQGTSLTSGGSRSFGHVVEGDHVAMTFAIRNSGNSDLQLTGTPLVGITGADPGAFSITTAPITPVSAGNGLTTFVVRFSPVGSGQKSAALIIPNSDSDETPFVIQLTGTSLAFTQDTDGDGLNDASEFQLAALGFDWQVTQNALVQTLMTNANGAGLYTQTQYDARYVAGQNSVLNNPNAFSLYTSTQYDQNRADGMNLILNHPNDFSLFTAGQMADSRTLGRNDVTSDPNAYNLYTPSQVQALNVGVPLIQKNPTTGVFTLTLGVQKSSDLSTFTPFPMTAPQCTINGQGRLEFQFTSPTNAAFFKVQAQ